MINWVLIVALVSSFDSAKKHLSQPGADEEKMFTHSPTRRMVKVCEKNDSPSCRMTSMGSSRLPSSPRQSPCGGMGDLTNNWRMLAKLGSMKINAYFSNEMLRWTMWTLLANVGLLSKNFFTSVSCLDIFLPLSTNMKSRKIYFRHDPMNARSARDKTLRFASANGSFATCSMMETSRSSERRESCRFSMPAKRKRAYKINQLITYCKPEWSKGISLIALTKHWLRNFGSRHTFQLWQSLEISTTDWKYPEHRRSCAWHYASSCARCVSLLL